MGLNFSIWTKPYVRGSEPESDIHLSLQYMEELDLIAKKRKVKTLASMTIEADGADEGEPMVKPQELMRTIDALLDAVRAGVKFADEQETEILIEEFLELKACLAKVVKKKAQCCLTVV